MSPCRATSDTAAIGPAAGVGTPSPISGRAGEHRPDGAWAALRRTVKLALMRKSVTFNPSMGV